MSLHRDCLLDNYYLGMLIQRIPWFRYKYFYFNIYQVVRLNVGHVNTNLGLQLQQAMDGSSLGIFISNTILDGPAQLEGTLRYFSVADRYLLIIIIDVVTRSSPSMGMMLLVSRSRRWKLSLLSSMMSSMWSMSGGWILGNYIIL